MKLGKTRRKKSEKNIRLKEANLHPEIKDKHERAPKSVIFTRKAGSNLDRLAKQLKTVFYPYTAIKFKFREKNSIREIMKFGKPYGITHMLYFTCTEQSPFLRIIRTPGGPTLTFKVASYSYINDVERVSIGQRRPPPLDSPIMTNPPVVLVNNFSVKDSHVQLMKVTFQQLFPAINVHETTYKDITRVVLFQYDEKKEQVDMRHYQVELNTLGLNKSVKKVVKPFAIKSLRNYEDAAQFVLGGTGESKSDKEDDPTSRVELEGRKVPERPKKQLQKSVRLHEIGPRMCLKLVKVEAQVNAGQTLYHRYVKKTQEEIEQLEAQAKRKAKLRKKRKREQEENIKRKEEAKNKRKKAAESEQNMDEQIWGNDEANEAYYEKMVGAAPGALDESVEHDKPRKRQKTRKM